MISEYGALILCAANAVMLAWVAYVLERRIARTAKQAREMRAKTIEYVDLLARDIATGLAASDAAAVSLRGAVHRLSVAISRDRNAKGHLHTVETQLRIFDSGAQHRQDTVELLNVLREARDNPPLVVEGR